MIIEYPSNPFPQSSTIYNIDCFKEQCYIEDLDNDNIPELIMTDISNDNRFDDYVVYTCKNNTIYYCDNIRNVLDCGPSDERYFYNDCPGVFVYDYRVSAYMQVILNNTVINRSNKYIPYQSNKKINRLVPHSQKCHAAPINKFISIHNTIPVT